MLKIYIYIGINAHFTIVTDNGRNLKIELELCKAEFAKSGSWAWVLPPGASVA